MLYNDLIQIKNAYLARLPKVVLPYSHVILNVLKVLEKRKYVGDVSIIGKESKKKIHVELLYTQNVPHLHEVKFYSTPGKRLYMKRARLHKVRQGYGDLILSTSQGIMTGKEAKIKKVGGEVICEVF